MFPKSETRCTSRLDERLCLVGKITLAFRQESNGVALADLERLDFRFLSSVFLVQSRPPEQAAQKTHARCASRVPSSP